MSDPRPASPVLPNADADTVRAALGHPYVRPETFRALNRLVALASRAQQAETERDAALAAAGGPLYAEWSQQWVDQTCHYRNLAIALGAKPEDMLDGYDRKLCESGVEWDEDYTQKNEAREAWADLEAAETERDDLNTLLDESIDREKAAEARVAELEAALREQWIDAHADHCQESFPHEGRCHWPPPPILAAALDGNEAT